MLNNTISQHTSHCVYLIENLFRKNLHIFYDVNTHIFINKVVLKNFLMTRVEFCEKLKLGRNIFISKEVFDDFWSEFFDFLISYFCQETNSLGEATNFDSLFWTLCTLFNYCHLVFQQVIEEFFDDNFKDFSTELKSFKLRR